MDNLRKLKKIAIQDEPNNVSAIFADDVSISNILPTFLVFISFFFIILALSIFAPNGSDIVDSTLSLGPNTDHGDTFNSIVTNISSINQKLRISVLYENATLDKNLSKPIQTSITADFYSANGTKLDSTSISNSIPFNRPVPLFQTSIIDFSKLEMKTTIDTKYDKNHTISLKYEFISAEASFFQLKARSILSIISIATFIFLARTISRTLPQVMTLFLHVAALFVFNPLQIIFNYFPSLTFLCFDYIFKNVGLAYFYFYCNMIFFTFNENVSKFAIAANILIFIIVFLLLLSKDFSSLLESFPTIYPLEFNGVNYNANKFVKQVVITNKEPFPETIVNRTYDLALKLAFLETTTINETNLNVRDFSFLIVLLFVPLFVTIMYSIFNVQDIFFHRTMVFAFIIAFFALGLTIFFAVDVIDGVFHGKLVGWLVPLASLSTFSLIFTFFNLEDDRDATYEYVMANENGNGDMNESSLMNNNDTGLGLDEDEEQMKKKK